MNDQSELQTAEASFFAEDAEFSESALAAAGDSHARRPACAPFKNAPLDHSNLARRIHDNLNWAYMFDHRTSAIPPADLWGEIKALLAKPNQEFVTGLYEVLLGRPPEPVGVAILCASLKEGASRAALVRTIALSDEATACQLDLSWLPYLDEVEADVLWEKVQLLWDAPDRVFVSRLYPLLLVRPPEPTGVAAHCRALKTGASRASVVRAIALSDEAQVRGLSISWLPQLEILPPPSPPAPLLSLHWLKTAFRRWRNGNQSDSPADAAETVQPARAAVEGGRV
jgi:hypothetical protein